MEKKTIKAWAITCNKQEPSILGAHWDKKSAIKMSRGVFNEGCIGCTHQIVPCEIKLIK